jgi:uncharacterized protein with PIN domain
MAITVVPFGEAEWRVAGDALLYVGDDFAHTDIVPAMRG